MRMVLLGEAIGMAGLLTLVVGSEIMDEQFADERRLDLPPAPRKEHCALNDSAKSTKEKVMVVFPAARDELKERVTGLIARLREESAA